MTVHAAICALLLLASASVQQSPARRLTTCADFGHPLFGCVVCAPGDADGDGTPDFLVADTGWNRDKSCPRAWLLSGYSDRVLFTRALEGGDWILELGIIGVEDCDGDGVKDWLLSPGWRRSHQPDCLTLVSGKSGAVLRELDPQAQLPTLARRGGAPLTVPVFDPTVLRGRSPEETRVVLGDLDRDGVPDVALGGDGWVEFRSGKDGGCLRRLLEPRGPEHQGFGRAIARLGDIDGDGLDDVAIASPEALCDAKVQAFSSSTGKCLYTVGFDWTAIGWGERIAALGDMDGDGCSEVAVATWSCENTQPGQACILSGKTGTILAVYRRPVDDLLVASTNPAARVKYPLYVGSAYPRFGSVLVSAGDMDRDGSGDFLVGDPGSPAARIRPRAWLVSGKDLRVLATGELPASTYESNVIFGDKLELGTCADGNGDGQRDWIGGYRTTEPREGVCALLYSGAGQDPVAWRTGKEGWPALDAPLPDLGDIDGDGRPEQPVLGADGSLAVLSSSGAEIYRVSASPPGPRFRSTFSIVEDLDGDRIRDFVASCDNRESFAPGRVFVFSGKSGRRIATLERKADGIERLPLERK